MKPSWKLCDKCLAYLKMQGTQLLVGEIISQEDDEELICDWCEDDFDELNACYYKGE